MHLSRIGIKCRNGGGAVALFGMFPGCIDEFLVA